MWRVCSTNTVMEPSRAPGSWACQLIRAELVADVLVLDLVDIDDGPLDTAATRPRGPFTLHIGPGPELTPDSTCVLRWAARADVITMIAESSGDTARLGMSNDEQQLILEISGAPGELPRRGAPAE